MQSEILNDVRSTFRIVRIGSEYCVMHQWKGSDNRIIERWSTYNNALASIHELMNPPKSDVPFGC